jgi:hypothetical protein
MELKRLAVVVPHPHPCVPHCLLQAPSSMTQSHPEHPNVLDVARFLPQSHAQALANYGSCIHLETNSHCLPVVRTRRGGEEGRKGRKGRRRRESINHTYRERNRRKAPCSSERISAFSRLFAPSICLELPPLVINVNKKRAKRERETEDEGERREKREGEERRERAERERQTDRLTTRENVKI